MCIRDRLNEDDCVDSRKNYTDINYALRYTQKNNNINFGVFVAKESDEKYTKGKDFYAIRSKKKIGNRTIGYFLTHVENNFLNESATVNVVDFANVKSNKLTTYNDLITSEREGESGFGFRSQFNYKPTQLSSRSGSLLYFDDSLMLNDFGYLRKNDWFHIGLGSNITLIDFKKRKEIKELEL